MPSTLEMRPSCGCPLNSVGETLKEVLLAPPDEIVWSSHSKWLFSCYLFILLHQPLLHPHDYPIPLITSSISCSVVSCDPMDCSAPGFPVHHQHLACSNSCPSSQWCHPTIPSSVIPFSSCPQSFPASGSFQMSLFCASGGQSTGVSALASVFPMNTQHWSL